MHIQMRLDPQILKAAKRAAELEGKSLSEYLRNLVMRDAELREKEDVGVDGEQESGRELL